MTTALKIKELLRTKNIVYLKVAELTEISLNTVKNYLNGKTPMTVDFLEKIAEITNVSISYFFEENKTELSILGNKNIVGNKNIIAKKSNINIDDNSKLQHKIELLEQEITHLKEIIEILKNQNK